MGDRAGSSPVARTEKAKVLLTQHFLFLHIGMSTHEINSNVEHIGMRAELLEELRKITLEEQAILSGKKTIEKELYTSSSQLY